jgi:hypothetical protein
VPWPYHGGTMTSRVSNRLVAAILIALMAVGSVAMWLGVPYFWVWLASRLADSSQPEIGSYAIVMVGIPITMVLVGKVLFGLNQLHADLTGTATATRVHAAWLRSMRDERGSTRPRTVLDVVMVWSVGIAVVLMAFWFFFIAGSSLPR